MLSLLRQAVGSWVAKIFLGLLVASFAIWGVEGIFLNAGTQSVATVGDQTVSTQEFNRQFRRALDDYNRQNGTGLTLAQAVEQGLHYEVLTSLAINALYAEQADRMDLGVSTDKVRREIRSMRGFTNSLGEFDKAQFDYVMRQNGLTEKQFIALIRKDLIKQEMILAITAGATAPEAMVQTIFAHRGEQRMVEYVTLTEQGIGALPDPDDATLKDFHQSNAAMFTAPEMRDVSLLVLSPAALTAEVAVTDEDIAAHYEDHKDGLSEPELRSIERVVFANMDAAQAARTRVEAGESLSKVGAELTALTEDDILRIGVERDELDPAEADIAFSLDEGAVSQPIETPFGPNLIRVIKIKPAAVPALSEVRDQIEGELKLEKAADLMFDLIETVEDSMAGGSTLEETAEAINVPLKKVSGLDPNGFTAGMPAQGLPQHDVLIDTVFEQDQGYDSDLTEADDGSYYIVRVDKIEPSALKPFETVRADVKAAWIADQKADRLANAAAGFKDGLTAERLPDVAAKVGSAVRVSVPINRFEPPEGFTRDAIEAIFAAEGPGAVVDAPLAEGHMLGVITKIEKPDAASAPQAYAQMKRLIDQSFMVDLGAQFQGALEAEYGIELNERAISLVVDQGQ